MLTKNTIFIALAFAVVGLAQSVRPDYVLDLTALPRFGTEMDPTSGSGGALSGTKVVLPVTLRLVGVDRTTYKRDEEVVFEVILTNAGQQDFIMPWSNDLGIVERGATPDHPAVTAHVSLVAFDADTDQHSVSMAGVTLFGTSNEPSSLKTLAPGQTALIRAPGRIVIDSASISRVTRTSAGLIAIRSSFTMATRPFRWAETVYSENQLGVNISLR